MNKRTLDRAAPRTHLQFPLTFDQLPAQTAFVHDWDYEFRAYGGGIGNGKTSSGAALAYWLSVLFPDNLGFIGRWDGKELRTTTIATFLQLVPPEVIDSHNTQTGIIRFKREYGGSQIIYSDLKEARYLKNFTFGWFWIDQAEELDEERFQLLVQRKRKQTPLYDDQGRLFAIAPTYGLLTFNPEGSDHFIYKFFHPSSPDHSPKYKLYMATTYDSVAAGFVSQEYVDNMLQVFGANEQQQKRYLEGAWDIYEGRIYPAFDPAVHSLESCTIRPSWQCYETIDHGSTNPTAVGWWVWTEPCPGCGQATRILVDEHYEGGGKGVAYHAAIIKHKRSLLPVPVKLTYLDSACWAMNQSKGMLTSSIHLEYVQEGIHPVPGPKGQREWDVAFSRITRALQPCPHHRHPVTGEPGAPHLFYLKHCRRFEMEAIGYRWKKRAQSARRNAPDEPQDYNDHHMDAWAYLEAASTPDQPREVASPKPDALALWQRIRAAWNPLADQLAGTGSWQGV